MSALFASIPLAPRDPILGINEAFNQDPRADKVNLGVGVYLDEKGRIPVLDVVAEAERQKLAQVAPRGYLPIDGIAAYDHAVQALLLGGDSPLIAAGRAVTAQSLGGTGGLKIGADLLKLAAPQAKVAISDPSWENHRAIFELAGFDVVTYPYYDPATRGLRFDAMLEEFARLPAGTIVVLHACCHNPTGVDPTPEQWQRIVQAVDKARLVAFLDIAYQGFGSGIDADAHAVRLFAESGQTFLVSSSFSKSFSLYGERIGALTVVDSSRDESARVLSQLKRVIRANYSNPPTHGGSIVTMVLTTPSLREKWEQELSAMRERIKAMRRALVDGLRKHGAETDFSFILRQNGMFSYTGLTAAQVQRLRDEFGIHAVSSGRICVAALNTRNVDGVARAVAAVIR